MLVREAAQHDAEALAQLLGDLGYPTESAQVERRLALLRHDLRTRVFVADEAGSVTGFIAIHVVPVIERDRSTCRITAVAVEPTARGRGIGRALIERVESEARSCGCDRLEATSSERRQAAHSFYRELDFEDKPHRFVKPLQG